MSTDYAKIIAEYTTEPPATGAVLRRLSDIPAEKLSWLWPGRIPLGKLTLLAGDPGLGKSFVTLDIAARVTMGTAWPDGTVNGQPGSVILLSAEDDAADTIRPRLEAAGADITKIHVLQAVRHIKDNGETSLDHFSLQSDITALQDAAVVLDDVRLIIIDPISAYLGSTDSHVNSKVRGLLAPLAQIAQTLRIAVVLVDHLSKSNRPALYRPNGSIAFTAAARAVWFFAKSPDDPAQRLMLPGKINVAADQNGLGYMLKEREPGVVAVEWGDVVTMTADSVLQPEDIEDRSERLEAMDWLRERLADGAVSRKQIMTDAKAAGHADRTLRRAKDALGVVVKHDVGFQSGWLWRLPTAVTEPPKVATNPIGVQSKMVDTYDSSGHLWTREQVPELHLDADGPGCTCRNCECHFGTVAGWQAHIARGRCIARSNGVVE